MRTHSEWNQRVAAFAANGTVNCPDCGERLPAGDDAARQTHYAQCRNTTTLSGSEQSRLTELEVTIEGGLKVFFEVGTALLEIRDKRLYRSYGTFEDYCRVRWQLKKSRAYQLMSAVEIIEGLKSSTIVELPANEAQTRPLKALPEELRPLAWDVAVSTSDGDVTASHVKSTVEVMLEIAQSGAIDDGEGGQVEIQHATQEQLHTAIARETVERKRRQIIHIQENSKSLKLTGVILDCAGDTPVLTVRIDGDIAGLIGRNVTLYVKE